MKKTTKTKKAAPGYQVDLKELLEAGVHFGHQARRWNPKMGDFIYTKREGVHIFDLGLTAKKLGEAMNFVRDLVAEGKEIVLIGAPYVAVRWLGGMITNWGQLKKSIDKLNSMEEKKKKGEFKKYTKRENVMIDKDIARLNHFLSGLRGLTEVQAAIFVVDVKKEEPAVKEAMLKDVTVVAVVDTNSDPDMADY